MPSSSRRSLVASILAAALALPASQRPAQAAEPLSVEPWRETAGKLIERARADRMAWARLAELTDTFGNRLAGSAALEAALAWARTLMAEDGLENVRLEPVMVPRWVRGRESAALVEPFAGEMVMLGLGDSVGTGPGGITAEVLLVTSFEDLEARAELVQGRIVFFDVPFTSYEETVRYRGGGASAAAKHGARAVLIRSVGPIGLRTPHTGGLRYEPGVPKIPAAALAVEDAQRLRRIHERGQRIVVRLSMEARTHPDVPSANLVGEIRGRELPDEVVLVGGHLDSWDVGTGAMDDGGGCAVTWEALRLVKALGLRPRRTLRVVLFTNEENGLRGGLAYRDAHAGAAAQHVLALESDNGAFKPTGFDFTGSDAARAQVAAIARLLEPLGAGAVGPGGGGADIGPIARLAGIPTMSPRTENDAYFIYHHTAADTLERLDPAHVTDLAAAIAVMAYVVADLPARLGE
ncbi:MAG: M20/M25/M40 family metallo-hydrolase [Vicinamibacteria bacterium]